MNVTSTNSENHASIANADQLSETFTHYFAEGAPTERFIVDKKLFDAVLKEAEILPHALHIGGNAALLATKMIETEPHLEITLVGPIGPRAKALLHPSIMTQNTARIAKDELHIIMDYKMGQIYGEYVAPSSSRFIASHDLFSSSSIVIDMFFNTIASMKPDLVVLSGLHLLGHQSSELFQEKVRMIRRSLVQIPRTTPVHLQLGSIHKPEQAKMLLDRLVPQMDSIGVNEQELAYLSYIGDGPYAYDNTTIRAGTIHVHKAVEMINWLLETFGHERGSKDNKRLTRVHFHSLTYHIIAVRGQDWSNLAAAAAAGARTAVRYACGTGTVSSHIDVGAVDLRISNNFVLDKELGRMYKFNAHDPLASWMRNDIVFVFTPVLVCKYPISTVGIPDAIAGAGLIYSQFYRFGMGAATNTMSTSETMQQQQQQTQEQHEQINFQL